MSLVPMLQSKCNRLYDPGNMNVFISGGTIKVKITESSSFIAITHTQDFTKYFSEFDLLPTSLQNIVVLFKCCFCDDLMVRFVQVINLIVLFQKFAQKYFSLRVSIIQRLLHLFAVWTGSVVSVWCESLLEGVLEKCNLQF